MAPRVIRSLGATAPPRPSTEDGTIIGTANNALAFAAVFKKTRLFMRKPPS
jgi:hypothetical protein